MTQTVLLSSLTIHPVAAALPMPADDSPVAQAMLASLHDVGQLTALKVSGARIVDGRLRARCAQLASIAEVVIEQVEEKDVTSIVFHSLVARRHYSKSALAYVVAPMIHMALDESRQRQTANLKKGSKLSESTQWTLGTAEDMADKFGISRSLLFMALSIRKKFAANPEIKAEWEPKILAPEDAMGLGKVQQAIAGKLAAIAGQTTPKGDAAQLVFEWFSTAKIRFERWGKLSPAQRTEAIDKLRTEFLPSLPPEMMEAIEEYLRTNCAVTF